MSDEQPVYGLYESFSATCDVNLSAVQIHHHQFVARNDEEALAEARRRSGMLDVEVRKIMDVRPMP